MIELNTFSIAGRCARSGQLGIAVSTAVPAVGGICSFIRAGVGAVATQSWVNPYLGIDGLDHLAAGDDAEIALAKLLDGDPGIENRQFGIVDAQGRTAAYTGPGCVEWAGHVTAPNVSVQGNMLTGPDVIDAMHASFEATTELDLAERLLAALEAGQRAGGDKRGKQSAGLLVFSTEAYPLVDIRADEHPYPVAELRRIFEIQRHQLLPFRLGMPTREDPVGGFPDDFVSLIMRPPPHRPGGGGSG